ncbi:hypothetical protein DSLASN_19670 [Desulfoluna limicola]|uniref:Uncharacterized protein n=1 Tax=Desulfoluna limicola TaxID=2810562 RepID=A0ABM7PGK7_9BACT|nr:hypothetical protein DSLASN_19670 [Desulfoluna limicola]
MTGDSCVQPNVLEQKVLGGLLHVSGVKKNINGQVSLKNRSALSRGMRGNALRQPAFKVAHLAAGGGLWI